MVSEENSRLSSRPSYRLVAVYRAFVRPGPYFSQTGRQDIFHNFLWGVGPLLVVAAFLIFLAAFWNAEAIRQAGETFMRTRGLRPEDLPFALQPTPPSYLLTFPLYWLGVLLYMALVRCGMLALFNAVHLSYITTLAISGHAAFPMIIVASVLGLWNQLFPITLDSPAGFGRVMFALVMCLVGWLLECRSWLAAGREVFEIRSGQSVFTWLTPILTGVLLMVALYVVLLILAANGLVGE